MRTIGQKRGENRKPLRLEYPRVADTAVLTVETFSAGDHAKAGQDFARFLKAAIRDINERRVRDLIVDIRANDGGDNYAPLLFSYLTEKEFRLFDYAETSTDSLTLLGEYSHLDAEFRTAFRKRLIPRADGRYRLKAEEEPGLSVQKPQPHPYSGRVWFLIDGETFSTGAEFCSIARGRQRGLFVGEETGGATAGTQAARSSSLRFPNRGYASPSRLSSSLWRFHPPHRPEEESSRITRFNRPLTNSYGALTSSWITHWK